MSDTISKQIDDLNKEIDDLAAEFEAVTGSPFDESPHRPSSNENVKAMQKIMDVIENPPAVETKKPTENEDIVRVLTVLNGGGLADRDMYKDYPQSAQLEAMFSSVSDDFELIVDEMRKQTTDMIAVMRRAWGVAYNELTGRIEYKNERYQVLSDKNKKLEEEIEALRSENTTIAKENKRLSETAALNRRLSTLENTVNSLVSAASKLINEEEDVAKKEIDTDKKSKVKSKKKKDDTGGTEKSGK